MEYSDEDFYYEDDLEEELNSYNDDGLEEDGGDVDSRRRKSYTILTEERIRQLQDSDISQVCSLLSVSRGLACTLLRRYNWSPSSVSDEWFANEEKVREALGLLPDRSLKPTNRCKICLEKFKCKQTLSCPSGHPFCTVCWKSYVSVSINDGPGCLSLRCPEPECKSNVGAEIVEALSSDEDKEKYYKYLLRSYVEDHMYMKWCPGPGCDRAVEIESVEQENYDVACDCSHVFCWNCTEEIHRPVDCKTVEKWIKLNASEAENTTWLLAYTKACPKCKNNIEKNMGCNHMTCRSPCHHQFCWLCLGAWNNSHNCNMYQEDEVGDKRVKGARKHLQRYAHYYERWASNHKSWTKAMSDLDTARNQLTDKLINVQKIAGIQMEFAVEAWEQIVECRRVLKWSYAYGYYLCCSKEAAKIAFFEFLQGQAEVNLERLHHCAEYETEKYVKADCPSDDFVAFREKLLNLTKVTRNYFEELVRALENDLSEVTETRKKKSKGTSNF